MLSYEVRGPVGWLRLDRPDKLNAMTRDFWEELRQALERAGADDSVRAVVFHGAGRCFSVGGDIEGFGALRDTGDRRRYAEEALGALHAVEELPKPTIAAVHGFALGGGCELTLVCDIVVADETARFGVPETAVGLMPGLAVARGRAHTGLHWLKYLIFTGEQLDADQALVAGLVNRVTPRGGHEQEAERLALAIAEKAPLALAVAKRILGRGGADALAHSVEAVTLLQGSDDVAEGVAAFAAKRAPDFRGR